MNYDFVEIGTSDFDSLCQTAGDKIGLSIEPIAFYLNRLPSNTNVTKVNCAISDTDGTANVYWIDPSDIEKYGLPDWLRGCNSIVEPHPTAISELASRGLGHLCKCDTCETISWNTLISKYSIESIDYLKIDTEGHDHIILSQLIESHSRIFPKKILFESNSLTDVNAVKEILDRLADIGYVKVFQTPDNTCVELVH